MADRKLETERRTVFVRNLPLRYRHDKSLLSALFEGLPDAKILHLNATYELLPHGRCFGYVEFDSPEAAARAIDAVHNKKLEGLTVQAQPMHALLRSVYILK